MNAKHIITLLLGPYRHSYSYKIVFYTLEEITTHKMEFIHDFHEILISFFFLIMHGQQFKIHDYCFCCAQYSIKIGK